MGIEALVLIGLEHGERERRDILWRGGEAPALVGGGKGPQQRAVGGENRDRAIAVAAEIGRVEAIEPGEKRGGGDGEKAEAGQQPPPAQAKPHRLKAP